MIVDVEIVAATNRNSELKSKEPKRLIYQIRVSAQKAENQVEPRAEARPDKTIFCFIRTGF